MFLALLDSSVKLGHYNCKETLYYTPHSSLEQVGEVYELQPNRSDFWCSGVIRHDCIATYVFLFWQYANWWRFRMGVRDMNSGVLGTATLSILWSENENYHAVVVQSWGDGYRNDPSVYISTTAISPEHTLKTCSWMLSGPTALWTLNTTTANNAFRSLILLIAAPTSVKKKSVVVGLLPQWASEFVLCIFSKLLFIKYSLNSKVWYLHSLWRLLMVILRTFIFFVINC